MKSQAGPASPSTSYYNPIVPSLTSTPSSVDQTFASTSNISSLESPKVLSLSSYVEATSPRQQEFKKIEKSRKRLRNRFSSSKFCFLRSSRSENFLIYCTLSF